MPRSRGSCMFEAVDALQPLICWQVRQLSVCDPGLAAPALTGKMLGDLREYGGRADEPVEAVDDRAGLPRKRLVPWHRDAQAVLKP